MLYIVFPYCTMYLFLRAECVRNLSNPLDTSQRMVTPCRYLWKMSSFIYQQLRLTGVFIREYIVKCFSPKDFNRDLWFQTILPIYFEDNISVESIPLIGLKSCRYSAGFFDTTSTSDDGDAELFGLHGPLILLYACQQFHRLACT